MWGSREDEAKNELASPRPGTGFDNLTNRLAAGFDDTRVWLDVEFHNSAPEVKGSPFSTAETGVVGLVASAIPC